jgi:putative ABC transport system permease protein
MIRPRWRKVLRDLWDNKVRSLLVVASIFIGVFSVGLTVAMYLMIGEDLNTSWSATRPSNATIYTSPYEPEFLETIRRLPGVGGAEGSRGVSVQLRVGPDRWIPLYLTARPDYGESQIDLLKPQAGVWPPDDQQLVIERASLQWANAEIGDVVEIKLADDTLRKIPLVGSVHDAQAGPGSQLGLSGYVTLDTLEWLHSDTGLTSIAITVSESSLDKSHIQSVADGVAERVHQSGGSVYYVYVPPPGKHPGYDSVLGVIAIIGALGFMSLILAGFLIYNTFTALMVQHVRYIGMMKAIGARRSQIIGMYLVLIMTFSFLALVPAIPLSTYAASMVGFIVSQQFNYETLGFRAIPAVILLQVGVGLGIPLLAGILPVYTGTHITVHKALSTYGLGNGQIVRGLVDRLVENIRGLSRPLLISLRNTVRRKGRLVLTLTTLTLGGAIFVSVFNLRASLVVDIEQIGKYFLADANVGFYQPYRLLEIEQYLRQIPGVKRVEGWAGANAELLREDGTGSDSVSVIAPPVDSDLVDPVLLQGRWLVPGDENAIVLNSAFWKSHPGLKVGDEIQLDINDHETTWRVVGFFKFPGDSGLLAYTTYEYLTDLMHAPKRAYSIRIVGSDHSPEAQNKLAKQVESVLKSRGFQIGQVQTSSMLSEANAQVVNIIVGFFLFFAILVAVVGAIGLMGTMSMNVLERTREIGVMRAIGASNGAVFRIVLMEGMLIGLLSWGLGALAAIPITRVLYDILSQAVFESEGTAVITQQGFAIWLGAALILSALACLVPARSAARMTVRDVLVYE